MININVVEQDILYFLLFNNETDIMLQALSSKLMILERILSVPDVTNINCVCKKNVIKTTYRVKGKIHYSELRFRPEELLTYFKTFDYKKDILDYADVIVPLYKEGKSISDIAFIFSLEVATVKAILKLHRVSAKSIEKVRQLRHGVIKY